MHVERFRWGGETLTAYPVAMGTDIRPDVGGLFRYESSELRPSLISYARRAAHFASTRPGEQLPYYLNRKIGRTAAEAVRLSIESGLYNQGIPTTGRVDRGSVSGDSYKLLDQASRGLTAAQLAERRRSGRGQVASEQQAMFRELGVPAHLHDEAGMMAAVLQAYKRCMFPPVADGPSRLSIVERNWRLRSLLITAYSRENTSATTDAALNGVYAVIRHHLPDISTQANRTAYPLHVPLLLGDPALPLHWLQRGMADTLQTFNKSVKGYANRLPVLLGTHIAARYPTSAELFAAAAAIGSTE